MSDQQKLTSQVFRSLQTREIDTFKTKKMAFVTFCFFSRYLNVLHVLDH